LALVYHADEPQRRISPVLNNSVTHIYADIV